MQDPASSLKPNPAPHDVEDKQAVWSALERFPPEQKVHAVCPVVDVYAEPVQEEHGEARPTVLLYLPASQERQSSTESRMEKAEVVKPTMYLPGGQSLQSAAESCKVVDVPGSAKNFPDKQTLHDADPADSAYEPAPQMEQSLATSWRNGEVAASMRNRPEAHGVQSDMEDVL